MSGKHADSGSADADRSIFPIGIQRRLLTTRGLMLIQLSILLLQKTRTPTRKCDASEC